MNDAFGMRGGQSFGDLPRIINHLSLNDCALVYQLAQFFAFEQLSDENIAKKAKELSAWIEENDLPIRIVTAEDEEDGVEYEDPKALRDGSRQTTLALNDVTAPASVHPLLTLLRKLAVEEKLKRQ